MKTETRNCQSCKKDFTVEPEDFDFYQKMDVPAPTWCPECRMMRRMVFWNERNFFKKVEKRTGKEIFSTYPPESYPEIYEHDYWWSDAWDPLSYGREIDWNRPFLAQVFELAQEVPLPARSYMNLVNSDYSNNAADMKNAYMCFNADQSEDCMYGVGILRLKNCLDIFRASDSELCYDGFGIFSSYQCFFSSISINNRNVWLSWDLEDCSDCFGCVNLRHKQYYIFNEPYTKEEYFAKLKEMNLGSYASMANLRQQLEVHKLKYPRKFMAGMRNQNVTGENIRSSKDVRRSYAVSLSENLKYSQSILMGAKDSYDYTNWGDNAELLYEAHDVGHNAQRVKFSILCFDGVNDIEYSMHSPGSANLFGCNGLRKKQYCILNKQYSKEEYRELIPKIKKSMDEMPYVDAQGRVYKYGEFFPPEFSPFAANETALMDFVGGMDKQKALENGFAWREADPREYQITVKAADLPDHINDVKDEIVKEVIGCATCNKGYRVVSGELQFLRRFGIPLPRLCFNCRHAARVSLRNKPVFYKGACQCAGAGSTNGLYKNFSTHPQHGVGRCPTTFETSYAPERPEIVYCEPCYQQEMV